MAPSSGITVPLMYAAPGEHKNATVAATSSARPSRFIGVFRVTSAIVASGSGVAAATRANNPMSVAEGYTTFTRTCSGACSIAACFARLLSAPFDAQYAA